VSPTRNAAAKLMAALAFAPACMAVADAAPAHAGSPRAVPVSQTLVVLEQGHAVYSRATRDSHRQRSVKARRPITGARTVLPVLGTATGPDDGTWLRVKLPGRPNGHTGWILPRPAAWLTLTPWRIRVDTSQRRIKVFRSGRLVRTLRGIVGAPSTPTPRGLFFVEESVRLGSSRVGAPFALALSARSNVLEQFAGGPGQIALHGLGNVGGTIGTAVSHGCVRLANRQIRWLAARIGPGVPVAISR
jgi:lipoprotein-anchoring transpeptidase ErfK/SrfK